LQLRASLALVSIKTSEKDSKMKMKVLCCCYWQHGKRQVEIWLVKLSLLGWSPTQ